eukprot:scaffold328046_cov690-Tisochrysis_lutea.AAC.2
MVGSDNSTVGIDKASSPSAFILFGTEPARKGRPSGSKNKSPKSSPTGSPSTSAKSSPSVSSKSNHTASRAGSPSLEAQEPVGKNQ